MKEQREQRQDSPAQDTAKLPPLRPLVPAKKALTNLGLTKYTLEAEVELRRQVVIFLLWAYGLLLLNTAVVIYLQGFHGWGFRLDADFVKWLGGATIAQVGGLLILTVKAVVK